MSEKFPTINEINEALEQATILMRAAQEEINYLRKENEKLQQMMGFSIQKGEVSAKK
jgi:hypothetical protein